MHASSSSPRCERGQSKVILAARCARALQNPFQKICSHPRDKPRGAERRKARSVLGRACEARQRALRSARSPSGAPLAALARGFRPLAQLRAMLAETWFRRALPAFSHPSAVAAPHAPAVVPEGMMPEAARERIAGPRAGAAPRSAVRIASGMRPSGERGDCACNINSDECQVVAKIATILLSGIPTY